MAYNPFNAASGIVENKRKWANAKAKGEDTKPYEESAAVYYKELRDNGRGDVADYLQKSDSITAGEYLKQLQPEYGVDATSLQKKSDDAYNWTKGIGGQLNKDYDMVYQTIGVTPTRTDYGKDILSGYGLVADAAYKSSLGGGAENNGGNVDSYAAAQANRNKADMVKEGYGTVLDYYNSIAGNATNWANSKAGSLGGFATMLQDNVNSDRDILKTAFNGTVDLWKTQDTNKTNKEIAESADNVSMYLGDLGYKGIDRQAAAQEKTTETNAEAQMYGYDKNLEGIKDTNFATMYGYDKTLEGDKYVVDANKQIADNNIKTTSSPRSTIVPDSDDNKSSVYNAESVFNNIVKRHTKDDYTATGGATEYGDEYVKNGTKTDYAAVSSDLQTLINDEELPEYYRAELYELAKANGISVTTPQSYGYIKPVEVTDGGILRRVGNAANNDKRIRIISNMLNNGTLTEGNAAWLINKYNIEM